MKYLLLLDKDYFYYYLSMHPEVMEDQTIRKKVLDNYLSTNRFRRETLDYYHDKYSPTFVNNLRRLTYDNAYYNFSKYNRNHNRHNDININLKQDQLKRDLWQQLQERYQQIHEENIKRIEEKPPDEEKPLPTKNTSDTQQKIDDILKKHREKMDKRHRKVQKDAENRVKVLTERMNVKNGSRFKRWRSSHAHNTRHDCNDLQIVPIDKKFIIVNDKTGQTDMLDYPGDPSGSPGNVYNCLCDVDFDEDILKDGINPTEINYQQIKQEQTQKSEEIILMNDFSKKNKNKQKELNNFLSSIDYSKDKKTTILFKNNRVVTNPKLVRSHTFLKLNYPKSFNNKVIVKLNKFNKKYKNLIDKEYGAIYDYKTGKQLYLKEGSSRNVEINLDLIEDIEKHDLVVTHNHPNDGPPCFSTADIRHLLVNKEDYIIAVSEKELWISKNINELSDDKIDEILKKMKLVEEEHKQILKIINDVTYEKYDKLKPDYKKNGNYARCEIDRNIERAKLKNIVNEITGNKMLEILNENGVPTNKYLLS